MNTGETGRKDPWPPVQISPGYKGTGTQACFFTMEFIQNVGEVAR